MRIGIPVFNNRVSPVFDWARRLLVVDVDEHGKKTFEKILEIPGYDLYERVDLLVENKVEVLVCAGICMALLRMIIAKGISVIPGIVGDVDDVIEALIHGNIEEPKFVMPGFRRFKGGMWTRKGGFTRGRGPRMGRHFWKNSIL